MSFSPHIYMGLFKDTMWMDDLKLMINLEWYIMSQSKLIL